MESAACRCQVRSFNYPLESMGPHLSSGSTYPIRTPAFWMGPCHFSPKSGAILPWSCCGYRRTRTTKRPSNQSRLQAGATLAPWFRCGVLVRRSLRVYVPARRCCPDPVPLATFVLTSLPRSAGIDYAEDRGKVLCDKAMVSSGCPHSPITFQTGQQPQIPPLRAVMATH